jgi:hypothetical protein
MRMRRPDNFYILLVIILSVVACAPEQPSGSRLTKLKISENGRYFTTVDNDPFFWLGDTGWLLFLKLTREEAEQYLEDRKQKGFNVIQVMVLHSVKAANAYGDSALVKRDVAQPLLTTGNSAADSAQYDYWDHVDFIIDKAGEKGIYMALVPIWGSNVKAGYVNEDQAKAYATFLANRYKDRNHIIWLNGGDIRGSDSTRVWNVLGSTLRAEDPGHLITFHPRGRTQSSEWFHNEPWMDFNMFQSGHRRYDQDTAKAEHRYGEDNWRYIQVDYNKKPVKPTLDGEPSYEQIPQGLHDPLQPRWTDSDVRRYGYWSVFAGACGYTYGHNSVMQMLKPGDEEPAYGAKGSWSEALNDPGAGQMIHLKNLMLSRPYAARVPDQSLVTVQGEKYDYVVATRGKEYAFVYTYNGRTFTVALGKIDGKEVRASWYSPRDGSTTEIGLFDNNGVRTFDPPGDKQDGNDWVLILDSV